MRGRNVNTSRQFTNFPPVHQARLTKHYKTLVGQENFLGEKELLCEATEARRRQPGGAREAPSINWRIPEVCLTGTSFRQLRRNYDLFAK